MSVELGNYKGLMFVINHTKDGGVFYEWNGNTYLRFYELCADINKFLGEVV